MLSEGHANGRTQTKQTKTDPHTNTPKKTKTIKNPKTFLSCEFPWPAELCKYHCTDRQLVSVALMEIKYNSSDANDFLLICSSIARYKTSFLTSVTTCTSHQYENPVWSSPKINGALKTGASKGSTVHFPIYT